MDRTCAAPAAAAAAGLAGLVGFAGAGCHGEAKAPDSQSVVTLRDAGRAPLHALAYRPGTSTRQVKFKTGPATTTIEWKPDDGRPSSLRYRFVLTGLDFADTPAAGEAEVLKSLIGKVTGTVVSDAHGRATAINDSERYRIAPAVPDIASLAIVPLPTEAIGVGARWTVTGHPSPQLPIKAALDYEAIAISPEGATVRWTGHYDAETGERSSDVDGQMEIRFDDVMPLRGSLRQRPVLPSPDSKPIELMIAIE